MRVNLDNIAPWILAVNHAVRLHSRVIISDGHALFAAGFHDFLRQLLKIRICDAKIKDAAQAEIDKYGGKDEFERAKRDGLIMLDSELYKKRYS